MPEKAVYLAPMMGKIPVFTLGVQFLLCYIETKNYLSWDVNI